MNDQLEKNNAILLVDDDEILLDTVADLLRMMGYAVVKACDGEEALAKLAKMQPGLIISDILMPKIDGYELLRQIQAHPEWKTIPLIFLSALWKENETIEGLSRGAADFLTKPFNAEQLIDKVRQYL